MKQISYHQLFNFIEQTYLVDVHCHPITGPQRYDGRDYYPVLEPLMWLPYWPNKKDRIAVFDTMQAEGLHALYGYTKNNVETTDIPELDKLSFQFWSAGEKAGFSRILDICHIEKVLDNSDNPKRGLDQKRIYWVPSIDNFFFPLDASAIKNISPQLMNTLSSHYHENVMLGAQLNMEIKDLSSFMHLIDDCLAYFGNHGAVALKVLTAYYRTLDFGDVDAEAAEEIFKKAQKEKITDWLQYKKVQDYLARYIFLKAGQMKLPVHFHTGFGARATLRNQDANPWNLESIFNDMRLVNTNFLVLHGGYPLWQCMKPLLEKRNVFVDMSAFNWMVYEDELGRILQEWLTYPGASEKIMFGSDAGAPIFFWIAATNSRRAIYKALSALIDKNILDEDKAIRIAEKLMRTNALRIHKL